ncbi:MAG: C-terminal domain, partial [Acidimicrobiaceae bacterium]
GTAGARTVTREHAKGDVALRGPAEALRLTVWGRRSAADAGLDVVGDASVLDRWTELLPPM